MKNTRLIFLTEKLKQGEREYFDEFYALTKGAVFYTVKKYVSDDGFAQNVAQDAYVAFLYNLSDLKDGRNPLPYLLTVAKNKTIDELRRQGHIDRSVTAEDISRGKNDAYFSDYPLLEKCRKSLSAEDFRILELIAIEGHTCVSAAKILNRPVSTIHFKYRNVLKKIKEFYTEVYHEKKQ